MNYYERRTYRQKQQDAEAKRVEQEKLWLSERKPLIKSLKDNSKDLKVTYLVKTEEWANTTIDRRNEWKNTYKEYISLMVWEQEHRYVEENEKYVYPYREDGKYINEQLGVDMGMYSVNSSGIMKKYVSDYYKVYTSPASFFNREKFIEKSLNNAEDHYQSSIIKLAYRIVAKGLDINNLQFTNSHVGINIDTIITDGVNQVKAQTICAWGEIQRPHYRYLVK